MPFLGGWKRTVYPYSTCMMAIGCAIFPTGPNMTELASFWERLTARWCGSTLLAQVAARAGFAHGHGFVTLSAA
jgi:hypothetical protein